MERGQFDPFGDNDDDDNDDNDDNDNNKSFLKALLAERALKKCLKRNWENSWNYFSCKKKDWTERALKNCLKRNWENSWNYFSCKKKDWIESEKNSWYHFT